MVFEEDEEEIGVDWVDWVDWGGVNVVTKRVEEVEVEGGWDTGWESGG